ncbi:MAG: hypothetical protein MHPSP_002730, partial [Paramarteilia canceri]
IFTSEYKERILEVFIVLFKAIENPINIFSSIDLDKDDNNEDAKQFKVENTSYFLEKTPEIHQIIGLCSINALISTAQNSIRPVYRQLTFHADDLVSKAIDIYEQLFVSSIDSFVTLVLDQNIKLMLLQAFPNFKIKDQDSLGFLEEILHYLCQINIALVCAGQKLRSMSLNNIYSSLFDFVVEDAQLITLTDSRAAILAAFMDSIRKFYSNEKSDQIVNILCNKQNGLNSGYEEYCDYFQNNLFFKSLVV